MEIGGHDIFFDVPSDIPVKERILYRMRKLWPDGVLQDTNSDDAHPILSRKALDKCLHVAEFLVYRDRTALEAWDRDEAVPENLNSMVCFMTGGRRESGGMREVTMVCGEINEEMNQLIEDLKSSFQDAMLMQSAAA